METLGQYLKKERLLHNAKIQDVSAATKIPVQTLQKIESDDWSQLPAAVFVKGFLKSYCHFLGLNTQDVLLRYDQQSIIPKVAQPLKENQKVSTQKNYPLYVWAGILTLAAIIFLFFISKKSEDIETATKLYSPMEATELNIPMPAPWYSEQGIQYYLRSYDSVWVKIQVDEFPVVSFPMDASTYKSF
ncbi:MAG: helix-turn-helix domain-containing protein [Deltaproteobacteria bacterium]|nr:helix-turn-helix domain-containing protein [Deltaproteobacteria bacterium]